jgi:hypothetical protein
LRANGTGTVDQLTQARLGGRYRPGDASILSLENGLSSHYGHFTARSTLLATANPAAPLID